MNTDKVSLLQQLRLDREEDAPPTAGMRRWWIAAALVALGLAVGVLAARAPTASVVKVRVAPVEPVGGPSQASSTPVLDASGYILARRQATISAKTAGRLDRLYVAEGERVTSGHLLARLDDSTFQAQLNQLLAQLQSAERTMALDEIAQANARRELERKRALAAAQFVSAADVDAAANTLALAEARVATARSNVEVAQRAVDVSRLALDDTVVRAPFSGTVTVREAQPGEIVSPISGSGLTRTGIVTVVDMDSLEAEVDVNENFIDRLEQGQKVALTLNAYPARPIDAYVKAIVPTVDRAKGTVKVRIGMAARDPHVLPNMGVRASFRGLKADAAPATARTWRVPAGAVDANGLDGVAFVLREGIIERRQVRLASVPAGGSASILHGVKDGEQVVVGGLENLRHGLKAEIED